MSDNLNDTFSALKKMVDSGNIPTEIQGLVNNLNNGNNNSNATLHNMISQVSPEMLNNLSSMFQSNSSNDSLTNSSNNSSNSFNLDPQTLMKMTSIINNLNKKDNPGTNLLHSLKPYLRDSRKSKLDQYANLLNITRIADAMKNDKKGDS